MSFHPSDTWIQSASKQPARKMTLLEAGGDVEAHRPYTGISVVTFRASVGLDQKWITASMLDRFCVSSPIPRGR
jgi:hypothetical protein